MNVPNHEKKAFRDMTPEERRAIVEAWLSADGAEVFHPHQEKWIVLDENYGIAGFNAYRTRPRQLVIPWEHIKPEYKWAAMDADGEVYLYPEKPEDGGDQWLPVEDDAIKANDVLNIDTTGIDWRESLTARPEGV